MYTIGEFAAIGRVSVRMLRHYDAIGILPPEFVDERTGYRHYADRQLGDLLRIVDLRDLGCGLDEIGAVLAASDQQTALREALVRRRGELEASVAADTERLDRIAERLHVLEGTAIMSTSVEYRPMDAVTVYAVEGRAPGMGPENVSPVIGPLLERLTGAIEGAGGTPVEPGIFWYDSVPDSEEMAVHVSYTADAEPSRRRGLRRGRAPGASRPRPSRRTTATCPASADRGWRSWSRSSLTAIASSGATREIYVEADSEDQSDWVTDLVAPVEKA